MPQVTIKMKDGGSVSPEKAKEILKHGEIRGKKLSKKQKSYFGYLAGGGKAENGASIEQISSNPYSSPIIQFNGPSHDNGGIDISYANQPVEVEGQETAYVDQQGSLNVLGNLNVPGTKTKFKTVGKQIAEIENKTNKQFDKGVKLINEANPYNKFERLKFNSGAIIASGAQIKQKNLTAVKEGISALQNDILEQARSLGVDPKQLQRGKAKFGIKLAQEGGTYPPQDRRYWDSVYNRTEQQMRIDRAMREATTKAQGRVNPWWMQPITPIENGPAPLPSNINPIIPPLTSSETPNPAASGNGKLSLAQRHNNPGNMMYNPNSGPQKRAGAVPGEPRYQNGKLIGHYAKFPTVEAGQVAMRELLTGPSYKNLTVAQASNRWTGEGAYKNIPESIRNVKIKDMNPNQLVETLNTFTKGEDSKVYNWNLPEMPQTGTTLPEVEITGRRAPLDLQPIRGVENRPLNPNISSSLVNPIPTTVSPLTPSTTVTQSTTRAPFRNPLRFGQIAPEIFTIATERAGFVPGQRFEPQLYQPYQVSFQDRLNENQATFNAISRQLGGAQNASAVASLAAQKYQADSQVLADEFRVNQGITNDITNRNISLLNQAQLTNLELDDQQFVRQEQARVNTRQNIRNAVQSISDKINQNILETRTYNTYSNLFPQYEFDSYGNQYFAGNPNLAFGALPVSSTTTPSTTRRR